MTTTTGAARSRVQSALGGDSVQRLLALGALVILLGFFSVVSPPFRTPDNYISILVATAVNGVLAMGVTFVIITGGIDLSVGTTMTFCSVVLGLAVTKAGLPLWLGVPSALAAGALVGRGQRQPDRQGEDPAVHRDPRHDERHAGPCPGAL